MSEGNLQDLKISGVGSGSGGKYNNVKLSGMASINGDIECEGLRISGTSDIKGNVRCREMNISGASDIRGNLNAERASTSGASKIGGDAQIAKLSVSGTTEIGGNYQGEEVEIKGSFRVKGDCNAESFKSAGAFGVGGLLNADDIEIKVYGKCKAREIGGENIRVFRGNGIGFDLVKIVQNLFDKFGSLIADVIEGDEVLLETTIAKVVRGNNVTIGKDSVVDLVEYRDSINIIDGAVVKEQRRL